MAPRKDYSILDFGYAVPIPCPSCGAHAHLVRRMPDPHNVAVEHRAFECTACAATTTRVVTIGESDEEIQALAERMSGVAAMPRRVDDERNA
jgi:C4-type Zn-finger protein